MKRNLITSLKELLKALGGKETKKNNIIGVIDDITEQVSESSSEQGGGNVVIVDLSELPVEHGVNAINPLDEVELLEYVYLFDVDPNKYYIFKTTEEMEFEGVFVNMYNLTIASDTRPFSACEDTSDEEWIEGKTFSDTVDVTMIGTMDHSLMFIPASTQFKTYKKYAGEI